MNWGEALGALAVVGSVYTQIEQQAEEDRRSVRADTVERAMAIDTAPILAARGEQSEIIYMVSDGAGNGMLHLNEAHKMDQFNAAEERVKRARAAQGLEAGEVFDKINPRQDFVSQVLGTNPPTDFNHSAQYLSQPSNQSTTTFGITVPNPYANGGVQ